MRINIIKHIIMISPYSIYCIPMLVEDEFYISQRNFCTSPLARDINYYDTFSRDLSLILKHLIRNGICKHEEIENSLCKLIDTELSTANTKPDRDDLICALIAFIMAIDFYHAYLQQQQLDQIWDFVKDLIYELPRLDLDENEVEKIFIPHILKLCIFYAHHVNNSNEINLLIDFFTQNINELVYYTDGKYTDLKLTSFLSLQKYHTVKDKFLAIILASINSGEAYERLFLEYFDLFSTIQKNNAIHNIINKSSSFKVLSKIVDICSMQQKEDIKKRIIAIINYNPGILLNQLDAWSILERQFIIEHQFISFEQLIQLVIRWLPVAEEELIREIMYNINLMMIIDDIIFDVDENTIEQLIHIFFDLISPYKDTRLTSLGYLIGLICEKQQSRLIFDFIKRLLLLLRCDFCYQPRKKIQNSLQTILQDYLTPKPYFQPHVFKTLTKLLDQHANTQNTNILKLIQKAAENDKQTITNIKETEDLQQRILSFINHKKENEQSIDIFKYDIQNDILKEPLDKIIKLVEDLYAPEYINNSDSASLLYYIYCLRDIIVLNSEEKGNFKAYTVNDLANPDNYPLQPITRKSDNKLFKFLPKLFKFLQNPIF